MNGDHEPVELEDRLRVVCGHLNVLHAELVALTAEALTTGAWQVAGIRSPAHWLSWQAGLSPHHAGEIVALAAASVDHPAVLAEFSWWPVTRSGRRRGERPGLSG